MLQSEPVMFVTLLWLAVGLAADAAAVSAARGVAAERLSLAQVLSVGGLFGAFQAGMPLIGWWLGESFGSAVQQWDHWIAFLILGALGGNLLREAWRGEEPPARSERQLFGLLALLLLALATSIDALAAGVTLPLLDAPPWLAVATVGITTAALSSLALIAGRRIGNALGRPMLACGGLLLVALGSKILLEHLLAAPIVMGLARLHGGLCA